MPLFAHESVGQALRLPANGVVTTAATRVRHLAEYISNSVAADCVKLSCLRCCRYRLSRPDLRHATARCFASPMNGRLLARLFRTFYRQSGRRLAVESSDLPPFKKSGGFQPLLLESTIINDFRI